MADRNTQTSLVIAEGNVPASTRATQVSAAVVESGTAQPARATQVSLVIITTIPLSSGWRRQRGQGQ